MSDTPRTDAALAEAARQSGQCNGGIEFMYGYMVEECRALERALAKQSAKAEVRLNDDSDLDEVVGSGAFQLEQMDKDHWFVNLGDVAVWLTSKKKISATYERRDALTWRDPALSVHSGYTQP